MFEAIILGIIQGITGFLSISRSADDERYRIFW